jgi:hypothetical protein
MDALGAVVLRAIYYRAATARSGAAAATDAIAGL